MRTGLPACMEKQFPVFPLEQSNGKQCFYLRFLIKAVPAPFSPRSVETWPCEVIKKNVIWSRERNNGAGMLASSQCWVLGKRGPRDSFGYCFSSLPPPQSPFSFFFFGTHQEGQQAFFFFLLLSWGFHLLFFSPLRHYFWIVLSLSKEETQVKKLEH